MGDDVRLPGRRGRHPQRTDGVVIEQRETWAAVIDRYGGLRASSDRIEALDAWGLDTTRRLLANPPAPTPFAQALLDPDEIRRRRV